MTQFNIQAEGGPQQVQLGQVTQGSMASNYTAMNDSETLAGILGKAATGAMSIYRQHDQNEKAFAANEIEELKFKVNEFRNQKDENGEFLHDDEDTYDFFRKQKFTQSRHNAAAYQQLDMEFGKKSVDEHSADLAEMFQQGWTDLMSEGARPEDMKEYLDRWDGKMPEGAAQRAFDAATATWAQQTGAEIRANEDTALANGARQHGELFTVERTVAEANDSMAYVPDELVTTEQIFEHMKGTLALDSDGNVRELDKIERDQLYRIAERLSGQRRGVRTAEDNAARKAQTEQLAERTSSTDEAFAVAEANGNRMSPENREAAWDSTLRAASTGVAESDLSPEEKAGRIYGFWGLASEGRGDLTEEHLVKMGFMEENEDGSFSFVEGGEKEFRDWQEAGLNASLAKLEAADAKRAEDDFLTAKAFDQSSDDYKEATADHYDKTIEDMGSLSSVVTADGNLAIETVDGEIITDPDKMLEHLTEELGSEAAARHIMKGITTSLTYAERMEQDEARLAASAANNPNSRRRAEDDEDFQKQIKGTTSYKILNGVGLSTEDTLMYIMRANDMTAEEAREFYASNELEAIRTAENAYLGEYLVDRGADATEIASMDPERVRRLARTQALADFKTRLDINPGRKVPAAIKEVVNAALRSANAKDPSLLIEMESILFGGLTHDQMSQITDGMDDYDKWRLEEFSRRSRAMTHDAFGSPQDLWDEISSVTPAEFKGTKAIVDNMLRDMADGVLDQGDDTAQEQRQEMVEAFVRQANEQFGLSLSEGVDGFMALVELHPQMQNIFMAAVAHARSDAAGGTEADYKKNASVAFGTMRRDLRGYQLQSPSKDGAAENVVVRDPHGHGAFSQQERDELGVSSNSEAIGRSAELDRDYQIASEETAEDFCDAFDVRPDRQEKIMRATSIENFKGAGAYFEFLTQELGFSDEDAVRIFKAGAMSENDVLRVSLASSFYSEDAGYMRAKDISSVGEGGIRLVPVKSGGRMQDDIEDPAGGFPLGIQLPRDLALTLGLDRQIIVPRTKRNRGSSMLEYSRNDDDAARDRMDRKAQRLAQEEAAIEKARTDKEAASRREAEAQSGSSQFEDTSTEDRRARAMGFPTGGRQG